MKNPRALRINKKLVLVNLLLVALGFGMYLLFNQALFYINTTGEIIWIIAVIIGQAIVYLLAAWIVWHTHSARSTLFIVIAFAVLFRLILLFTPPVLSSDIYRYIWDGRVQAAGINPYRYIPADESLAHLRDKAIYPRINRPNYANTIYPPVAQVIFLTVTRISESVTWMKAAMLGFEAVTMWALAALLASLGYSRHRILLYAWHPLLIWEVAGNGHVDAIAIAFIALALLARRRELWAATGVALACATLVKLFPVVLFPALYRRWGWKMPVAFAATIVLAYLPYISVGTGVIGFLPAYTQEEGLQSGERFFLLSLIRRTLANSMIPSLPYTIFAFAVLLAIALWFIFQAERTESSYINRAFGIAATFTLLLTPRYGWYYAWLVPFLCFAPFPPLLYVTTMCFLLYGLWIESGPNGEFTINAMLYAPFALLGLIVLIKHFIRFGNLQRESDSLKGEVI